MPAASALTRKRARKAANLVRSGVGAALVAGADGAGAEGIWGVVAQPLSARTTAKVAHSFQPGKPVEAGKDSGKEKNLTVDLRWRRRHFNTHGKDVNAPVTRLPEGAAAWPLYGPLSASRPTGDKGNQMTPEALMRRLAKAVENADLQSLVAAVDEEVVWHVGGRQAGILGLGGTYISRAGLLEVTAKLATVLNFYRFEPKEIIADGEIAWGWFDVAATLIGRPNQHVRAEVALRWRVRNGKILESRSFYDTADLAQQLAAHLG